MKEKILVFLPTLVLITLLPTFGAGSISAQANCRTFVETGKTVCGRFLEYWSQNGGLPQQGYPISDELQEMSPTDGKTYTVQYFERAVFELHPENEPPYDVLLSLLGAFEYKRRYGATGAPNQQASSDNPLYFSQTAKSLGGRFREYWEQHGGLAQQGYPISNEFLERNRLDGKVYRVQYFERAVFGMHPENQPPYDVLLSLLGKFRYDWKNYKQQPRDCFELYVRNGPTIAQGTNTVPYGYNKLLTYQLEELSLTGPITCRVPIPRPDNIGFQDDTLTFDTAWRLTITAAEPIRFGSKSWCVWLDGTLVGHGVPNPLDHRIMKTLIYDRTVLREGATIAIGYGCANPDSLPERLHFETTP